MFFQTFQIAFFVVIQWCWIFTIKVSHTKATVWCICVNSNRINQAINRQVSQAIRSNDFACFLNCMIGRNQFLTCLNIDTVETWVGKGWATDCYVDLCCSCFFFSKLTIRRDVVPRTIESSIITTRFPLTTPDTAESFIRTLAHAILVLVG